MSPDRLRIAAALFWRHLKPALFDPRQLPGLIGRLYGMWRERGLAGALQHHAPSPDLYADYPQWLAKFDTPLPLPTLPATGSAQQPVAAHGDRQMPQLSVLALHDVNTPQASLQLIADLRAQSSASWELLLGTSTPTPLPPSGDARVRIIPLADAVVAAPVYQQLNALLTLAHGACIFHSQGMRLHRHAAASIATRMRSGRGGATPRLIYWDHDELDAGGTRVHPDFKPDWNPALLRTRNYIDGAFVIATRALQDVGGYSVADMHSANWDLVLRATETSAGKAPSAPLSDPCHDPRIVHIAQVLTHHQAPTESATAATAIAAAERVDIVNRHLLRTQRAATASAVGEMVRIQYRLPEPAPRVSIIIPTRDGLDLLKQAIDSVRLKTSYANYEIIVVDNQSQKKETRHYFQELERTSAAKVVAFDAPFNYSAINNAAVRGATGTLLCFMNNDIEVISPDWMQEMAGHALQADTGVVGTLLYFPDGSIQHAGVVLGIGGYAKHIFASQSRPAAGQCLSPHWRTHATQNYSAVTAACIMVRKTVFDEMDGFDESFAVSMNDIDLCLRIQQRGYRNLWTPYAEMVHHESASRGYDYNAERRARAEDEAERFAQRWGALLMHDPSYNRNLALDRSPFMLAWPPRQAAAKWRDP